MQNHHRLAARRRARAVALATTADARLPMLTGLLLLGFACALLALLA